MKKNLGVYICHCGGNISDYVDVEKVRQAIEHEEGVVLAKTTMFACSDSNQKEMVEDIHQYQLDGVIVASCSPKLHLVTFRNVTETAGLNKYTYVHANIREQASWAHSDDKEGATEKAIRLVRAAISKSRYAEALYPNKFEAEKAIAVIGAGMAGMKAALSIAEKNMSVVLIEKENTVGGHVAEWGSLFMTNEKGSELVQRIHNDLLKHENISILTGTEVVSSKGSIGNFTLTLQKKHQPVDNLRETMEINVGSVVIATGFDHYIPQRGEFSYLNNENVISLPDFKKLTDQSTGKTLLYNGKEIHDIAYIYCVGSRQSEGENKYCSRFCCTSTIHTAIETKKKFNGIRNFHLHRGIRTYGKQELLYDEALQNGDIFIQFHDDFPPEVSFNGKKTSLKVKDLLSSDKELVLDADLVVLVTGMLPRMDQSIGQLFKLPKGRDNFYNEIHMKLRPVETVIDGITLAGTCQWPKNISESVNSALSAATKAFSSISKGLVETEPIVAEINGNSCVWCGECLKACPFEAIEQKEIDGKIIAVVNKSVCKGCGMCAPVCVPNAIDLIGYSDKEIFSMIDALVQ
jgi:heterodisulfide reductase subunit A